MRGVQFIDEHEWFRRGPGECADVAVQTGFGDHRARRVEIAGQDKTGTFARRRDTRKKTGGYRERVGVDWWKLKNYW